MADQVAAEVAAEPETIDFTAGPPPEPPGTVTLGVTPDPEPTLEDSAKELGVLEDEAKEAAKESEGTPLPAELIEKFKAKGWTTFEQVAEGYSELESWKSKVPEVPEVPAATADPAVAPAETPAQAPEVPQETPLADVLQPYADLFEAQGGQLAENQVQALAQASGIPAQYVSSYMAALTAQGQHAAEEVYEIVAPELTQAKQAAAQRYQEVMLWAQRGGVSPVELQAVQGAIASNDVAQIKASVAGLFSRFAQAGGGKPVTRVAGIPTQTASIQPFESHAQLQQVMNSPEYWSDPAVQAEVQRRLQVTRMESLR